MGWLHSQYIMLQNKLKLNTLKLHKISIGKKHLLRVEREREREREREGEQA